MFFAVAILNLRGAEETNLGTEGHRDSVKKKQRGTPLRRNSTTQQLLWLEGSGCVSGGPQRGGD